MTTNLFQFPGLFWVFWPISTSCSSDGLQLSSYFQALRSLYQSFSDCSKRTNYNWCNCHFHFPQFFSIFFVSYRCLSFFSLSFNFTLLSRTEKSTILQVLFFLFFFFVHQVWSSDRDHVIFLYVEIPEEFVFHYPVHIYNSSPMLLALLWHLFYSSGKRESAAYQWVVDFLILVLSIFHITCKRVMGL